MNARVSKKLLIDAGIWKKEVSEKQMRFEKFSRWAADTDLFVVDITTFTKNELEKLLNEAAKNGDWKALVWKINTYNRLTKNPDSVKINRLERLEPAIKIFLQPLKHKWLFRESTDSHMLPYYVKASEFHPARRMRSGDTMPASVSVTLAYCEEVSSVEERTIRFYKEDLVDQKTVSELFAAKKYYIENDELLKFYFASIETWKQEHNNTGKQFRATGHGTAEKKSNYWWSSSNTVSMEREGRMSKVVMDDYKDKHEGDDEDRRSKNDDDERTVSGKYWLSREKILELEVLEQKDEDELDDGQIESLNALNVVPPLHPYVNCFDLAKHQFINIHIGNLTPYEYDETAGDKLIMPKDKKELVGVLMESANVLMEDIVEGKTGGIIVLATGVPGTGKTLTAEIYSEAVKKPLYIVQCSQLGVSPEEIEGELGKVLKRATRWGAILLIDEADVYVRERGADIAQNAIVGVFLRVLEYYRGVLFMTSNRATIIDDAVMSRATAHIVYEIPDTTQAAQIWEVLSAQFKIKLKESATAFAKKFPNISGRTIKNLLKLSMLISLREKKPVDLELVTYAARFLDGATPKKD